MLLFLHPQISSKGNWNQTTYPGALMQATRWYLQAEDGFRTGALVFMHELNPRKMFFERSFVCFVFICSQFFRVALCIRQSCVSSPSDLFQKNGHIITLVYWLLSCSIVHVDFCWIWVKKLQCFDSYLNQHMLDMVVMQRVVLLLRSSRVQVRSWTWVWFCVCVWVSFHLPPKKTYW